MEGPRVMSKQQKTSLKLPIFLMIGPALGLILGMVLYAVINFILSGYTPDSSSSSISEGVSIAQGAEAEAELFAEDGASLFRSIMNIFLFLLGSISFLAFVPCLVFGIILFNKRRNARNGVEDSTAATEPRKWDDVK